MPFYDMNNWGILDSEFTAAGDIISQYGEMIELRITNFQTCLNLILETSIKDQAICEKIKTLEKAVNELREPLTTIITDVTTNCKEYITEVDTEDKFVYCEGK